jgi:hypothetical protein
MHQQGPPPQQPQTGSGPSLYHQQQQQTPQSHNASSSSFTASDSSGASTQNMPPTMTLSHEPAATDGLATSVAAHINEPVYPVQTPSFAFGVQDQPNDNMDFTFDTIMAPGSDDMLAAMQAIQNPTWWHTMMMPGWVDTLFTTDLVILSILISYICSFAWPTEEPMVGHNALLGNGLGMNAYQTIQPQPLLG